MKNYIKTTLICFTILISVWMLSKAYRNKGQNDIINVTGLGKADFVSDLIVWSGRFQRASSDLKAASSLLDQDREEIRKFLISKGVSEKEIVFTSVNIEKIFKTTYDANDNSHTEFSGYELSQAVEIESKEVDKIESVSREVSEIINRGVEFNSNSPEYFYTHLAELKIKMIAEATEDARIRAEMIAKNSNSGLGSLKYASQGIFQITAQNSSEDYSWGGAFNTSSKRKTAAITMKLQFSVN